MDAEHSDNAAEPVDNDSDEYFDGFDDGDSDVLSGDETDLYTGQYRGNESSSAVSPVDRDDPTRPWRPFTMPYQFRVLKVEQPKSSTDPISVKLVTRTLDSPGEFYALSYTWGEEEFTHFVYCGEHAIPVTANLHDALLVTRDLFYFRGVIHPDFHRSVYTPLAEREMCAPLQPFIWADAVRIFLLDSMRKSMLLSMVVTADWILPSDLYQPKRSCGTGTSGYDNGQNLPCCSTSFHLAR